MEKIPSNDEKRFLIRCNHCQWARTSTGLKDDLEDLKEVKSGCRNCGKVRQFRCPKCGRPSKMIRIRGNAQK